MVDDLSSGNLGNLADARSAGGQFNFHQIDIRHAEVSELIERRKPDVVVHLAAQADVRVSVQDPVLDASINIIGALNVLEGARRAGSSKVLFASSGGTMRDIAATKFLPTGYRKRPSLTTSMRIGSCTSWSTPHSPWQTSTALVRILMVRQEWCRSSPESSSTVSNA